MLSQPDYLTLDALTLAEGIRQQQFTAAEVMSCAIERAQQHNPALNAIVSERYDLARELAAEFDSKPELANQSNLAGLPFLIKDLSALKGTPVTFGSQLYDGYIAQRSSAIVRRYIDAGLIVFGKTNTPEFGLTLTTEPVANGITRNPWNLDYSTGGSSGGAAAAVAAGIVPVAHATDGGGSIRIPASCCGLFGLKPSRGLTAIEAKLSECWSGMSVGHVVSQTVRDSAAYLDLITLDEPALFPIPSAPDSFLDTVQSEPGKLRIGLQLSHPLDEELDAACLDGVRKAAELCKSLGHHVEEISHPIDYRPAVSAMNKIISVHTFQSVNARLKELDQSLEEAKMETSTRLMAKLGSNISADDYVEARDTMKQVELHMAEFHHHYDVIVSPVLSKTTAAIGWLDMNTDDLRGYGDKFRAYSGFTALFNGTGQPSMSVPLHQSENGLPVGVMFSAAWGHDGLLLQLARQLEQAQPWQRIAPAFSA